MYFSNLFGITLILTSNLLSSSKIKWLSQPLKLWNITGTFSVNWRFNSKFSSHMTVISYFFIVFNIYYTWKNFKSAYNNNKFKISAPIWNDEFDLPDGSYSSSVFLWFLSRLLWIYHQKTQNFGWKSSHKDLPQ